MAANKDFDVIVAGAGPVGLATAALLSDAGLSVALAGPDSSAQDRRTTALMQPAARLLSTLGIAVAGLESAAALRTMRIIDGTNRLFRSPPATFRASEIGETEFGWNVPNASLGAALIKAVRQRPIRQFGQLVSSWTLGDDLAKAQFENGETISAKLVAAADGRNSPARQAAGITTWPLPLDQAALVVNFSHSRDHGGISTEFHTEWGPCTQVPLAGRRSSLVWVNQPAKAQQLHDLDNEALSAAIEHRIASIVGTVTVEPGRQIYSLSAALPRRFAANRVMLVGEAAHIFPPIGAQGMNLGLRDAADLVSVVEDNRADPGAPASLDAYDRKRRPDVMARAGAVNMLNASLLSGFLPAQLLRSFGLSAISRSAPLRGFFMREGMQPGSGLAALFKGERRKALQGR